MAASGDNDVVVHGDPKLFDRDFNLPGHIDIAARRGWVAGWVVVQIIAKRMKGTKVIEGIAPKGVPIAAFGGMDSPRYPWGSDEPADRANYDKHNDRQFDA